MNISDIGLRYDPYTVRGRTKHSAQRGVIIGASQSGKSELATHLINDYRDRVGASVLVIDTKPRFRAEWAPSGLKAQRRYRDWSYGEPIENSMLVNLDAPASIDDVWSTGCDVAIAQVEGDMSTQQLAGMLWIVKRFYDKSRANKPRLLYVDELGDFYGSNGSLRSGLWGVGDQIIRCIRAGAERGVAVLTASQRPVCIPTQAVQEASVFYLFQLDNETDMTTLYQRGLSRKVPPIDIEREPRFSFRVFDKREHPPVLRTGKLAI